MTRLSNRRSNSSSFQRLITWSILVAAVFSGGLIAGYQLAINYTSLTQSNTEPAENPTSDTTNSKSSRNAETDRDEKESARAKVDYSFFDHLSRAETPSAALPTRRAIEGDKAANNGGDSKESEKPIRFTLQVAAHASLRDARHHRKQLKKQGLEAKLTTERFRSGKRYYRLQVGEFSTIRGARHVQQNLQGKNIRTFIAPL